MTTDLNHPYFSPAEQPYTVADLRRWAKDERDMAVWLAKELNSPEITPYRLAKAAAFTALADGIEACANRCESTDSFELSDAFVRGNNAARCELDFILRGKKL